MAKNDDAAEGTTSAPEGPPVIKFKLDILTIKPWDSEMSVTGKQIAALSDEGLADMQEQIKEAIEKEQAEDTYNQIVEVRKAIMANQFERDKNGKITKHPQSGFAQRIMFDLDDQRWRNRILAHIEKLGKGKTDKPITLKFTKDVGGPDQPSWNEALKLVDLMIDVKTGGYLNESDQIGSWIVDFAGRFIDLKAEINKLKEDFKD